MDLLGLVENVKHFIVMMSAGFVGVNGYEDISFDRLKRTSAVASVSKVSHSSIVFYLQIYKHSFIVKYY